MKHKGSCLRTFGWAAPVILLLVVAVGLFWPVNPNRLSSHANPALDYADAVARVEALNAREAALGEEFNPLCRTRLLTHGQKTARAVILVHGFTTCPNQYRSLAPQIFDLGYNVLLVPLPHHGLADRLNTDQGNLTAEEVAAYADLVVDIAQGLGEQVTMIGFSLGGATTAWAAEHRPDLDQAVLVAPALGYKALPTALTVPGMRAYQLLPDSYTWWNDQEKETCGPDYAYPRYSSRALAQILRLGQAVMAGSKRAPLQAKSMVVITNGNEPAVSNEMIAQAVAGWEKTSPGKVISYEFPAAMLMGHDIMDPADKEGNIEVVYPKLVEFIQRP
jgi:pimeloyl-ACP methyl ester carboxylesterase